MHGHHPRRSGPAPRGPASISCAPSRHLLPPRLLGRGQPAIKAHCIVTGSGWAALAVLIAIELAAGRSFVPGSEGLVFLAILIAGVGSGVLWRLRHGTNALVRGH